MEKEGTVLDYAQRIEVDGSIFNEHSELLTPQNNRGVVVASHLAHIVQDYVGYTGYPSSSINEVRAEDFDGR